METLDTGVEGFRIFSAADEEDGLLEFGSWGSFDRNSVEHGLAAFCDGPGLSDHGIVDDAEDDFVADPQGDGDAEVWDAVEEIHGTIDGIDDPVAVRILVSGNAFFAIERVIGTGGEQDVGDEVLGFLIECELDVVMMRFIDREGLSEMFAEEFSGFHRGAGG